MSENTDLSQEQIAVLQEENALLWQLINAVPHYLYVKDREHRFIITNEANAIIMGAEMIESLIGKSDFDLHTSDLAGGFMVAEKEIMDTDAGVYNLQQELKEPGTDIALWMSTTKVPLHDAEGNVIGLIGFAEDITERKLAEQMLSHQEKLINDQQEKLLELSTPVLPVSDNILLIPLIGTVDSMRALHIMRTVLSAISTYHARILILDISGMPLIDTSVANDLNRMIQAAALKGTEAIITGVSDAVAETIVDLGVDWSEIETLRDLQSGIQRALQKQHGL